MRALTVRPGIKGSVSLTDIPEPDRCDGAVLVESLAVGLCATDAEIVGAELGTAPPGSELLVIGHENLGRVLFAAGTGLETGDLVVGFVRHPDPVPCEACAVGEWDMCRNGRYTSHGITGRHGFARQRWRADTGGLVRLDPRLGRRGVLVEPMSVVVKAWEQIDRIGRRSYFSPRVAAVTGAGPVGLLAAMVGVRSGLDMHVFDRVTDGPKPDLVKDLGARYHTESMRDSGIVADIVVECTAASSVIVDALMRSAPAGITCLIGMSAEGSGSTFDVGAFNRLAVRQNGVVFGTVNANRRHYEAAASSLIEADPLWLDRILSRHVPLDDFIDAFDRRPDDIKVVLDLER